MKYTVFTIERPGGSLGQLMIDSEIIADDGRSAVEVAREFISHPHLADITVDGFAEIFTAVSMPDYWENQL